MVHVAGKVRKPGAYRLPPDSRVIHAIRAAGGCLPNADLDCLNLAREAKDGEQIYVPSKEQSRLAANGQPGRPITVKPPAAKPPSAARGVNVPTVRIGRSSSEEKLRNPGEGTVNINTADESELQRLPGVGPVTAQRILEFRQQNGSFTSAEQLMDVKGIGPKKFEKMAPFVSL
jgi:competence protein ComEA